MCSYFVFQLYLIKLGKKINEASPRSQIFKEWMLGGYHWTKGTVKDSAEQIINARNNTLILTLYYFIAESFFLVIFLVFASTLYQCCRRYLMMVKNLASCSTMWYYPDGLITGSPQGIKTTPRYLIHGVAWLITTSGSLPLGKEWI